MAINDGDLEEPGRRRCIRIPRPTMDTQTPLGNGRKAQEARNLEKRSQSGQKMKGGHAGVVGPGSLDQPHIGQIPPLVMLALLELIGDHA